MSNDSSDDSSSPVLAPAPPLQAMDFGQNAMQQAEQAVATAIGATEAALKYLPRSAGVPGTPVPKTESEAPAGPAQPSSPAGAVAQAMDEAAASDAASAQAAALAEQQVEQVEQAVQPARSALPPDSGA